MAKLTENGLEYQKLAAVLRDLQEIARVKFRDLLEEGEELSVDESSVLGRILGIMAEPDALNEELIFDIYSSFDPDQAEGIYLDKLLRLRDMFRKEATPALAMLILRGDLGVLVPAGASVANTSTGDRFVTQTDVTFAPTRANGVVINFDNLEAGNIYSLSYRSSSGLNVYPPIAVIAIEGDTKEDIANRFAETIKSLSSVLVASVDNDDFLHVKYANPNTSGMFTLTGQASFIQSYQITYSYSATFTAVRQAAGSLNVIQYPVLGWREVYNPFDSIESVPVESDKAFRARFKMKQGDDSTGNRQAMYGELYALEGVRFVNIQENVQDIPIEGRTAHGISVVVFGGDEDDIANTIAANLPTGCYTDGQIEKSIEDINGGSYTVRFSRPELVPIQIKIGLSTDSTFPSDGVVKIQDALVNYFESLNVGDDIKRSRLYTPINQVEGQSVSSLTIARKGQQLSEENIEIEFNQLAVISYEDIIV